MRTRLSLATQILLLQLGILLVTVSAGAAVTVHQSRRQLDTQYGERCLAIAESVASMPAVRNAFDDPRPADVIQPIAEAVRTAARASFVVVANSHQIRYSHPDPEKIGRQLSTDASTALTGRAWVGVQTGTLGRSMRAKVPVYNEGGDVIGVVSVGILEEQVSAQLRRNLPGLMVYLSIALLLGAIGAYLLARRVKRQTLGLEPAAIAGLFEHREAMLHGIKEGMLAIDAARRITLVNDEARRLLDLPEDCVGRRIEDLRLPPRLVDVLGGADMGPDQIVLRGGRVLVLNRMPVRLHDRDAGAVVTLRDRTELDTLIRELDGARSTTDALRAQAHEFSNRLHTVAGLVELGEREEALRFITVTSAAHDLLAAEVTKRVRDPALAALLVAKGAAAAERGATLRIADDAAVTDTGGDSTAALIVVGNLIDNALEALGTGGGWVEAGVRSTPEGLLVQVRDSGPGVAPELAEEVFREGFTTKVAQAGGVRGLGLALTRQACVRRGGWVAVHNDGGAVFTALLPPERFAVQHQ